MKAKWTIWKKDMTVILGVDPGSQRTGYGVIKVEGDRHRYVSSGYIDLKNYSPFERLRQIYLHLQHILNDFKPEEAAIEQIFMHENPNSALKLGQARGAAIVALSIPISEYSAREVKKSVVGHGAANKEQVQFMVQRLLNLTHALQADAADALAIALCHAQLRRYNQLILRSRQKR